MRQRRIAFIQDHTQTEANKLSDLSESLSWTEENLVIKYPWSLSTMAHWRCAAAISYTNEHTHCISRKGRGPEKKMDWKVLSKLWHMVISRIHELVIPWLWIRPEIYLIKDEVKLNVGRLDSQTKQPTQSVRLPLICRVQNWTILLSVTNYVHSLKSLKCLENHKHLISTHNSPERRHMVLTLIHVSKMSEVI